ncbi:hypothetical protein FKP32DRAFT_1600305 [Trametes sanguinea]|nr:hypothetical protein FKP32DRAFT_1600305 [Trametes sanguinea]
MIVTVDGETLDFMFSIRITSFRAVHDGGSGEDVHYQETELFIVKLLPNLLLLLAVDVESNADYVMGLMSDGPMQWQRNYSNNTMVGYNAAFGVTVTLRFQDRGDATAFCLQLSQAVGTVMRDLERVAGWGPLKLAERPTRRCVERWSANASEETGREPGVPTDANGGRLSENGRTRERQGTRRRLGNDFGAECENRRGMTMQRARRGERTGCPELDGRERRGERAAAARDLDSSS